MKRGTYRGPIPHMIGKTALLREATNGHVVAQFDDWSLTRSGNSKVVRLANIEKRSRQSLAAQFRAVSSACSLGRKPKRRRISSRR